VRGRETKIVTGREVAPRARPRSAGADGPARRRDRRAHHRTVHEEGYRVERAADGALRFRRPDGRPLPEVPPPAAVPADPVAALRAHHHAQGLRLHARTALPDWDGERLDLGWALDVLHPLANPPAS
jgi:hypothetical protein